MILNHLPGASVLSRFEVNTFLLADQAFAARHPELLQAILAAVYRASRWIAQSDDHLRTSLIWISQAQVRFLGSSFIGPTEPWLGEMRKETVEVPSYPLLPLDIRETTSLTHQQFEFLVKVGLLPTGADWADLSQRIRTTVLPEVIRQGKKWETERFDYAEASLYPLEGASR
jgi:hypothetical protein